MAYRFILNETSYHGAGAIQEIVTEIKARGFQKALIVTDADLVRFGVVKKVTDLLDENQFAYEIFDQVKANPSVAVVQAGVEAFKKAEADYMIAIGGGSPQDTSKGIGISSIIRSLRMSFPLRAWRPQRKRAFRSLPLQRLRARPQKPPSTM